MVIKGISERFHDAAVAVMEDDKLLFASQSERFSRIKNDPHLCQELRNIACDKEYFYEDWRLKNQRRQTYGQKEVSYYEDIECVLHHESHMAAAYYTAPFVPDVTVVIDAIGEYDTASIWVNHEKVWSKQYPWSLGLFYSAITKRIGLKPNEDEYITMGMAAYGRPCIDMTDILDEYLHTGIPLKKWFWNKPVDIAASAQMFIEYEIEQIFLEARKYGNKVAYGGGVALNCVANSKIAPLFDKMWIFPNPGDAGSALGCLLAKTKKRLEYTLQID